ncbi:hypothetical protein K488DRAFT_71630 [Vararia minispora EC-137]|uniref:Uncharacterized protein n=1 Tax=Vararia minispora EC-137 TaxID=1314806 RepID=A0ACB8QHH8_9AGAM|nr:hypothetical protein K488DRAFT_71630 [Vararia minispora EC-137]
MSTASSIPSAAPTSAPTTSNAPTSSAQQQSTPASSQSQPASSSPASSLVQSVSQRIVHECRIVLVQHTCFVLSVECTSVLVEYSSTVILVFGPAFILSFPTSFLHAASVLKPTHFVECSSFKTTFSSTVFVQTTESNGVATSFAPSVVTSLVQSTQSNGNVVTATVIVANPTTAADQGGSGSQFFRNRGAVAGVFLVVGLAAAAILLFLFFFVRRRRRQRRIEHDTAVSATLAAAGYNRAPIDDEDLGPPMSQSGPGVLGSLASQPTLPTDEELGVGGSGPVFDPYASFPGERPSTTGYTGLPTQPSPPPGAAAPSGPRSRSHHPSYSAGSYEPLLANMASADSPEPESPAPPTVPPRNPKRAQDAAAREASASHEGHEEDEAQASSSSEPDARLNPDLAERGGGKASPELRDDVDYSRPVLGVRNVPDDNIPPGTAL